MRLSDIQTYYKVIVIKTVLLEEKQTHNSMELSMGSEIDPHKYSQLIFVKETKAIQGSKNGLFTKCCCNNWTSTCKKKKMNLDTNLTPSTRINSKQITDLNVKPKTLKPLEDYIRKTLHELWNGNDFLIFSNMACFMNLHVILEQGPC